jgi:integrase
MARRAHGEGSIFRRSDGRWGACLYLEDGERKWVYGKTRQETQRKLAALRRTVEDGLPIAPERGTVSDYLSGWLETVKPSLRESGWDSHQYFVERHIIPRIGRVRLAKLSPQQVQVLYADCLTDGLSSTSVNHLHGTLHKALENAQRIGLVARNVTEMVDPPRVEHREMRPLNRDEAQQLLAVAAERNDRLRALWAMAMATGMRRGELLALHWADVELSDRGGIGGSLQVRWSLRHAHGRAIWSETKTRTSRRRIRLATEIIHELQQHRTRQIEERLLIGAAWAENDLVFPTSVGTPLMGRNVLRSLHRLLEVGELPRIRFHDLRHTCATLALLANVNVKIVSEMLGHSSSRITIDLYSHVLPDMQQDAAATLANLLYG